MLRKQEIETGKDSGSLSYDEYRALEIYRPETVELSLETGVGKSTVIFSNFSKTHFVFTLDEAGHPDGYMHFVKYNPLFVADRCTFILGPTQQTLPVSHRWLKQKLDYVLLDGPHALPLVHLEYYNISHFLRPGSVLAMDDLTIPNIRELFFNLAEDDSFELIDIVGDKLGFLRKTDYPIPENVTNDLWYEQRHNKKGYSAQPGHAKARVLPGLAMEDHGINFAIGGNSAAYIYHGWSYPEEFGTWSDGTECSIAFTWSECRKEANLLIDCKSSGEVVVYLNGNVVGKIPGSDDIAQARLAVGAEHFKQDGGANILILKPITITSDPGSHFLAERALGLFVAKIALSPGQ